jgi:hypothetical protein
LRRPIGYPVAGTGRKATNFRVLSSLKLGFAAGYGCRNERITEEVRVDCSNVRRKGRDLRVDVDRNAVSKGEADPIVQAVSSEAASDDFDVVRVTGAMLRDPPSGATRLLKALGDIAKRHGKRLEIGPI